MVNLILCGGSGTRLWPLSRKHFPKQYYKFINDESFFQKTVARNKLVSDKTILVASDSHKFILKNQLGCIQNISSSNTCFFLEPSQRNTAPAIALSLIGLNNDDIVLVTPSDHLILDEKEYINIVKEAEKLAKQDYIVTLGIRPDKPETGFGYIKFKDNDVLEFNEKPTLEVAKKYLSSGEYLWNAGIFVFKVSSFFNELKKHSPDIFDAIRNAESKITKYSDDYDCYTLPADDMNSIPKMSIDYAVMEKSNIIKVIKADIDWNDIGSFDSLYRILDKDKNGNVANENHIAINSKNNYIISSEKVVSLIGINNCVIIDTNDALLIADMNRSQDVKEVVELLEGEELLDTHLTVYRPWGSYTLLESAKEYKIKRIVVLPNKRLSLQSHSKRSEHWTVVEGSAVVTIGENIIQLNANESTYIPKGEKHRLENKTTENLVLIEVQLGEYLGEDDIVRFDDDFIR